jgi:hypothetical protein
MASFWVKDDKVIDMGEYTHIQFLIKEPELFGLTKKAVLAAYKKHSEQLYTEGGAREELIKLVSNKGWIRVRQYIGKSGEYWSIQFDSYKKRKGAVNTFILGALAQKVMTKYDTLVLVGFEDNYYEQTEPSSLVLKEKKSGKK